MEAIDFFCGAGGLTKGLSLSGINVIAGIDIDESFKKTFEYNNKKSKFYTYNIKELGPEKLKSLFPNLKENDPNMLFAGCAPCQAFSQQRRSSTKRTDEDALAYFGSLVAAFLPGQVFVENVKGLRNTKVFSEFVRLLLDNNYDVWHSILNAEDFGVPQHRKRLVLLATRGIKVQAPLATHGIFGKPLKTVEDAIGHFSNISIGQEDKNIPNHKAALLSDINLKRIKLTPKNGGGWASWPEELKLECHKNTTGYTDIYGRMSWKSQAPTITCKCISLSNGRYGHPEQDRAISLREAAALQSFPDDYIFFGNQGNIAKQIGNAVPVEMARAIGNHLQALRFKH